MQAVSLAIPGFATQGIQAGAGNRPPASVWDSETETGAGTEMQPGSQTEVDTETEVKAKTKTKTGTGAGTEAEWWVEMLTEPGSESKMQT